MSQSDGMEEISVATIFGKDNYIIPIYQRDYAWIKEDREALVEDFAKLGDYDYFLGSLIVNKKHDGLYEVVDGQQRLTTLFILLSILNKGTSDIKIKKDSLAFEARSHSNEALSQIFNQQTPTYPQTIADGYNDLVQLLTEHKFDVNKLGQAKLIRIEVPHGTDLNKYFEIMNTRGEQLEAHEVIKSRLMAELKEYSERELFSNIWDACSEMGKYIQQLVGFRKTKERDILFTKQWNDYKWRTDFDELHKVWEEKYFSHKINEGESLDQRKTLTTLIDGPEIIENPYDIYTTTGTNNDRFNSPLDFQSFLMYVHALMTGEKNNFDNKQLIDLFDGCYTEIFAKKFIMNLLQCRFYFDKFIIKRDYKNQRDIGEWSLKSAKKYDKYVQVDTNTFENRIEHNDILHLQSMFRVTYTSPKTMDWIYDLLKIIIAKNGMIDSSAVISQLKTTAARKVRNYINVDWSRLNKDSTNVENIVFNVLDYLLWSHSDSRIPDINEYEFFYHPSVEHWSPQTPRDNVLVNDPFRDPININHFGNLCLVTSSQNSANGNLLPKSKFDEYRKENSNQTLKMKLMMQLTDSPDGWTVSKMKMHGEEMIKLLQDFSDENKEN